MEENKIDSMVEELVTEKLTTELKFIITDDDNGVLKNKKVRDQIDEIFKDSILSSITLIDEALEDIATYLEDDVRDVIEKAEMEMEIDENFGKENDAVSEVGIWDTDDDFLDETDPINCETCGEPELPSEEIEDGTVEADWNENEVDWGN